MGDILSGLGSDVLSTIANFMWTFIEDQLKNSILTICTNLLTLISSATASFWTDATIKAFLDFSKWANFLVFGVATLFMLFDVAEEMASGKAIDYSMVFSNTVKAVIFAAFNSQIAIMSMALSDSVTSNLGLKLPKDAKNIFDLLGTKYQAVEFLILILLVVLVAMAIFFVMSVMRYGAMFVHILSSSFYIPDIVRGDTTSIGAWLRQMVAIAATYTIQYITFYLGLYYLTMTNIIMCAICWTGMFSVSKVLQKFGYSTGTRGVVSAAGSMAGRGISLLSKF